MNERIKKLIIDTLGKEGVIDCRAFGHWALSDDQLEKLAELIVRECVDIANKQFTAASGLDDRDSWTAAEIKQHFGVE